MPLPTRLVLIAILLGLRAGAQEILTPPAPAAPRINGPGVFGVRPGSPFLYTIPVTGERPVVFSAGDLPAGLALDPATGRLTGRLSVPGEFRVTLGARNSRGEAHRGFRIVVGERIALTPAMGWNSWNCWAASVDQSKVLHSARALVASGLINHGWTYINIDDTWQGTRGGPLGAIQPNEKFPDMKGLCDEIHRLGLKAGIYSTPWVTSYAHHVGGGSDRPDGAWTKAQAVQSEERLGRYSFAAADARQWAAWGFDYLKYDWRPNDLPHVKEMSLALRASGRDVIFSLSNTAPFEHAADWARWANSWRTTGDVWDHWETSDHFWRYGVSEIGFSQDRWVPFAGPGHWNDPDMLVVGYVGWGPDLHPSRLTADEQYSHMSLWCLLSAPLLIGADLDRLDAFTLGLLGNDEVLALDQDALGIEATRVAAIGPVDVLEKPLEDGSRVLGFFNRGSQPFATAFTKLSELGFHGRQQVRDLWRQRDLAPIDPADPFPVSVPAHGVLLLRLAATR